MKTGGTVLILGSAPDAPKSRDWPKSLFSSIVAINNAWRARGDWDYLVCPDDFPAARRPRDLARGQRLIGAQEFIPANNRFGGVVYAGGTMAFTAGYWALSALKPSVLAFFGCDMIYPSQGRTHFYGEGSADPLRDDVSLRNLEAKSARLMLHAARQGCACVRLSTGPSRLVFPSVRPDALGAVESLGPDAGGDLFDQASERERDLGYLVESGRYWEDAGRYSTAELDRLDAIWLRAAGIAGDRAEAPRRKTA